MDKLDTYVEQLYDTKEAKLEATSKVLKLARSSDNLEDLLADGIISFFSIF